MVSLICMFVAGYAWCKAWSAIKEYVIMPYTFDCPYCEFRSRSSNKEGIDAVKELHNCLEGSE